MTAINFPDSPVNGQIAIVGTSTYTYNSTHGTWDLTTAVVAGPTGPTGPTGPRGVYLESPTPPVSPSEGDAWFDTTDGTLYIYYGTAWVETATNLSGGVGPTGPTGSNGVSVTGPTGPAGFGRFTASDAAPTAPANGEAWFDSLTGKTYIWYNDTNSAQWVQVGNASIGPTGPAGAAGATGPTGPIVLHPFFRV